MEDLRPEVFKAITGMIHRFRGGPICECGHCSAVHADIFGSTACYLSCACQWLRIPEGTVRLPYSEALAEALRKVA